VRLVNTALTVLVTVATLFGLGTQNPMLPVAEQLGFANVSSEERAAMEWAARETPEASRFVVVSEWRLWAADTTSEWFPALAHRRIIVRRLGVSVRRDCGGLSSRDWAWSLRWPVEWKRLGRGCWQGSRARARSRARP
jgi:hypothetical protein